MIRTVILLVSFSFLAIYPACDDVANEDAGVLVDAGIDVGDAGPGDADVVD